MLANINKSRLARESSNFKEFAKIEKELIKGTSIKGSDKINIRIINEIEDFVFINKVKEFRKNIPKSIRGRYNFGYADVDIPELDKKDFFAHSAIKDLNSIENPLQRKKLKDISVEPLKEQKVFTTLEVNERNIINGVGAWDRKRDAEFKILNEIAYKLGNRNRICGKIKLYTDLDCCPSCMNVIQQFKDRYPNVKIEIIYKSKGGGK